jgi:phenylacetate-CoA ligase
MTEKDMFYYIKTINRYKPDLITGYASSLYELVKFAERNNLKIYTPKMIVSSAETLKIEMREKIEATIGTKVYDFYGSRETASIAGECKNGLIHNFSFNNYIEIVDRDNNPVDEGQTGRVIVTNLHNYSMPLIRYEIGDMAILGPKKCNCGNFLPCLTKIYGRIDEQFIREDGNIVIGYFFIHLLGVLLNKGLIKKFQLIQEDYNKIRILAVVDKGLPEPEMNEIEHKIKFQMGENCKIIWEFVDTIPTSKSGKYLYTKSLIKK